MSIADALSRAAEVLNLADTAIAAEVGVSEHTVARWRTGKTEPRSAQLMALRRTYKTFADLLDGKEAA